MQGALDHVTRHPIVQTGPIKRSSDVIALLGLLGRLYGPMPGRPLKPVVIALGNGPIQPGKLTRAALIAPGSIGSPSSGCPKYAPEPNDIDPVWHDLKTHHPAHRTFTDALALDRAIHVAVALLNAERSPDPLAKPRTSA